ncbi:hypothetical protein ACPA9J_11875 [Pseudomonas aeruginosa]
MKRKGWRARVESAAGSLSARRAHGTGVVVLEVRDDGSVSGYFYNYVKEELFQRNMFHIARKFDEKKIRIFTGYLTLIPRA